MLHVMQSVHPSNLWPAPLRDAVWRWPHRHPARPALAHWPERRHQAETWSHAALRGSIALRNGAALAGDGLQRLLELLQHTAPRGAKRLRAARRLAAQQALQQVREACEPASLAAWVTQLAQAAQASHAHISHPARLTHALGLLGDAHTDVTVRIGTENENAALRATSVVASGYGTSDDVWAMLGVVGPTRMDYPSTMASVRAVARYVGRILAEG